MNRTVDYDRRRDRYMVLGLDTTHSSTSCELSSTTSKSEDASLPSTSPTMENARITSAARKPNSHTSQEDCRFFPLLKTRLGHLWDQKLHTDLMFYVGPAKEEVEAHRIILSSASYIFERLFYDSAQKPLTHLGKYIFHEPDYSKAAFEVFIKAMYTNEFPEDLTLSLALEIFYASKKYQVTCLENLVLTHILDAVSIDNVFEAMKVSTNSIELTKIVPICWKIIEENTFQVLETHLEHLEEHNLTRILTRDHLNIEEVGLFQFLVRWGSIQCKRRGLKTTGKNKRQMIDHMLKYIRFTTISKMDFDDIVIPSRILEPKEIFSIQSHISSTNGESKVAVPYNSRPRFKPRKSLRRPESLTHTIFSNSVQAGDGDMQHLPPKTKLRLKKTTKKINAGKPEKGSKTHR